MISLASLCWLIATVWMIIGGFSLEFPQFTPKFVLETFIYGKIHKRSASFLVPKSYFTHFYLSGVICVTTFFLLCLYVTCGGGQWPELVLQFISLMRYGATESYGDMFSNFVLLACANFQVIRRFIECITVSVYSSGNDMHIAIYFVGILFYAALPVTSVSGTNLADTFSCSEMMSKISISHVVGVAIFIWSSWQQNRISLTFAKLRKNKSGKVENTKHHIPHGGLFEYVSCPHYLVEILIYLAMNIITSFQNTKMIYLFLFVLTNQMLTGHHTHIWYKDNFKTYPKNRKAVIPFVY